jgi:hypothetical protein
LARVLRLPLASSSAAAAVGAAAEAAAAAAVEPGGQGDVGSREWGWDRRGEEQWEPCVAKTIAIVSDAVYLGILA